MRASNTIRRMRRRLGPCLALVPTLLALYVPARALAAGTASQSFTTAGEHEFVVPAGVTSLQVTLVGGNGGSGYGGARGGNGATVRATIDVTPGEALFVEVAGNGGLDGAGGTGDGGTEEHYEEQMQESGGGGGASDVRTCSITAEAAGDPAYCATLGTLASRLVVAGGGGGAGAEGTSEVSGGQGGNAGAPGDAGLYDDLAAGGEGGLAGGPASGGAAGGRSHFVPASGGTLGKGGNGASGSYFEGGGGGGGGGGIYGGGGGGGGEESKEKDDFDAVGAGGGGGGGSSGVPAGVTRVPFAVEEVPVGTQPSATLTWTLPPPAATTGTPSSVTATTATLNGSVNPDGSVVSECHFTISPVPPSGSTDPCPQQVGAGSVPVAVSASLTDLSPATTYTVTLVAASAQGSGSGSAVAFTTAGAQSVAKGVATVGAPTVTGLTLSPTTFRRGKHAAVLSRTGAKGKRRHSTPTATTISFDLSEAASVTVSFEQGRPGVRIGNRCVARSKARTASKRRACTRYVAVKGGVVRSAHAGVDKIRFEGILDGGKPLAAGNYRVALRASAGSATATASQHPTFTLLASTS